MKKFFSIGEAAKIANMTSETLRHYDRIGLVKPSEKDEWTNYRYYTKKDIVRLNAVCALRQMDLPLKKIKEVLAYDDLQKIIEFMEEAEKKVDEKIANLQYNKSKIQLAKKDYESKLYGNQRTERAYIKHFSERVIMLSETMKEPTLDNLWNYLSHFYNEIPNEFKEKFSFEDLAGIYTKKERSNLFAVCTRYENINGLKVLPSGRYLCADCDEENRDSVLKDLLLTAEREYGVKAEFILQIIIVSGILRWNYQIQIFLGE